MLKVQILDQIESNLS